MLAILVPSRKRPEQLKRMIESVAVTTNLPIAIYVGLTSEEHMMDNEDNPYFKWVNEFYIKHNKRIQIGTLFFPDNLPTAQKWNNLAEYAMKDPAIKLFMLGADDMYFTTPLWDEALIEHYEALECKLHVYALQDSRDSEGTPHPIMTREWVESLGYFVPPIFLHWKIDSWTVENAKFNEVFTHLKEFLLVHDKCNDKGLPDETHNKIRQSGWWERDMYVAKHCLAYLHHDIKRIHDIIEITMGRIVL